MRAKNSYATRKKLKSLIGRESIFLKTRIRLREKKIIRIDTHGMELIERFHKKKCQISLAEFLDQDTTVVDHKKQKDPHGWRQTES